MNEQTKNLFGRESVFKVFMASLKNAHKRHNDLGAKGLERIQKNQFGENALLADIECEKAVIDTFSDSNLPVRIISEEHGITDIGNPEFTAVLDDIDGTALYIKERNIGKYGTMLGVFEGTDFRYQDYLIGAIVQHATGKILLDKKNNGAVVLDAGEEFLQKKLRTSPYGNFDKSLKIYIDEYWDTNKKTFSEPLAGFNVSYHGCSCMYYADVAEGLAHFALECTRKSNLEIASAYGLITEAGGVIVDINGNDIGVQKYLEFGQKEHLPIIAAANRTLAEKLIGFLKKS